MILIAIIKLPINFLAEIFRYAVKLDGKNRGYWSYNFKKLLNRIK